VAGVRLASFARAAAALATVGLVACGGGTSEGGDGGADLPQDRPPAPEITDLAPTQGRYGTYVKITGTRLWAEGAVATLLLDDVEATRSDVPKGKCDGDRAHCVAWYEWTAESLVVALPITVRGGALAVRLEDRISGAKAFRTTELARLTGARGDFAGVAAANGGTLVHATLEGGDVVTRILEPGADAVTIKNRPGLGALDGLLLGRRVADIDVFVIGDAGGGSDGGAPDDGGAPSAAAHLYWGVAGDALEDTGIAVPAGVVRTFAAISRAGQPAAWILGPGGAPRLAYREDGVWRAADGPAIGLDLKGTSAFAAAFTTPEATYLGLLANYGTFDFKYDVAYARLAEAGGVVSATGENVARMQDDYAERVAVNEGHVFHTETRSASTTIGVRWQRAGDGTWTRFEEPGVVPLVVRGGGKNGFRAAFTRFAPGPYGSTQVIEVRDEPQGDGMPETISGDLMPIYQDALTVVWDGDATSYLLRDRDPGLAPLERGFHRWVVPAP